MILILFHGWDWKILFGREMSFDLLNLNVKLYTLQSFHRDF